MLLLSSSGISETGVRGVLFDCDGKADGVMVVEGVVSVCVVVVGVVVIGVVVTGVMVVDVSTVHD